jgi:hypothetical protein
VGNCPEVWGNVRSEWHRRAGQVSRLGHFRANLDGYSFGGAGGRALQRVVTRLKITGLWLAASPRRTLRLPAVSKICRSLQFWK